MSTATSLTKWTNQMTGEVRIYVQHGAIAPGDELYLLPTTGDWRIQAYDAKLKVAPRAELRLNRPTWVALLEAAI